jgi:hypothetical protein
MRFSLLAAALAGAFTLLMLASPGQAALGRCQLYLEAPPLFVKYANEGTRRRVHERLVRALPKREGLIDTFNVFAWDTWSVSPQTHEQDAKGIFKGSTFIEDRGTRRFRYDRIGRSSLRLSWDDEGARFVLHLSGRDFLYIYPKTLNNYVDKGGPRRPKGRVVRLNTVAEFADGSQAPVFFELEFRNVYGSWGPSRMWSGRLELESLGRSGVEAHRLFGSGVI